MAPRSNIAQKYAKKMNLSQGHIEAIFDGSNREPCNAILKDMGIKAYVTIENGEEIVRYRELRECAFIVDQDD